MIKQKKYVVIGTYPEHGSKNIGDQLITNSTIELIRDVHGHNVLIETVWRGAKWDDVKQKFKDASYVVFACLAIRNKMELDVYPYLEKLLELNIPMAAIAAGTALDVTVHNQNLYNDFVDSTKIILRKLDEKMQFLSTRGYLSQEFCRCNGMSNTIYSGDVAFYSPIHNDKIFPLNKPIRKIVISDPHRAPNYMLSFDHLVRGVRTIFPNSEISIALHGNAIDIEQYAKKNDIKYFRIYEDKDQGLDMYDSADLHIGYRVHAHVSSLKRRIYSYLLEQDGRGADYGCTLERKITVPNYLNSSKSKVITFFNRISRKVFKIEPVKASTIEVQQMLAMLRQDKQNEFRKFIGLEKQIVDINHNLVNLIKKIP